MGFFDVPLNALHIYRIAEPVDFVGVASGSNLESQPIIVLR